MLDATQFSSWVLVALFFVSAGLLFSLTAGRGEVVADRWERVLAWLADHGHGEVVDDEELARVELRQILREDRLLADLDRLRHLIATDTYMSATRQIGNRIAYEQVLAETRTFAARPAASPYRITALDRVTSAAGCGTGPETLDIRWR